MSALILVDGRAVGRGQADATLGPGRHALRVEAPGHVAFRDVFKLSGREAVITRGVRLVPSARPGGALALQRGLGDIAVMTAAALDLLRETHADSVIVAFMIPGSVSATLVGARFDQPDGQLRAAAAASLSAEGPVAAAMAVAARLEGQELSAEALAHLLRAPEITPAAWNFGLGFAAASGAGVATHVSEPGLAPSILALRIEGTLLLGPRVVAVAALRHQPLEPRATLAMLGLRVRPGKGPIELGLGAARGEIAHTVVNSETGRANRAGETGVWVSAGLAAPLTGPVAVFGDLMALGLWPRSSAHVDATVGLRIQL